MTSVDREAGAGRTALMESRRSDGDTGAGPQPQGGPSAVLMIAVLLCCFSPLLFGLSISFTSPTEDTMQGNVTNHKPPLDLIVFTPSEGNWYASLLNVGAVIGAFSGSALNDLLGRKKTLALSALPHLIGWVASSFSSNVLLLIGLRLLIGWAVGLGSAVAPSYLGEVAPVELRGALGAMNQLSVTIGIFLVNILGSDVFIENKVALNSVTKVEENVVFSDWRHLCLFSAVCALLLAGIVVMPESPRWLASKGRVAEAKEALQKLRNGDVSVEFQDIQSTSGNTVGQQSTSGSPGLGAYRKSLVIGIGLLLFQQFAGTNAIMMYTKSICESAGMGEEAATAAIVAMGFQVVVTGISCYLVEKAGRRALLLLGLICMSAAHFLLTFYYFAGIPGTSFLALIALAVFLFGFGLGMGPIPWLILAELFPVDALGKAAAIATAINWSSSFIITLIFKPLQDALGEWKIFLIFALICVGAVFFVAILVPETKGKSVEQVLALLHAKGGDERDVNISLEGTQGRRVSPQTA